MSYSRSHGQATPMGGIAADEDSRVDMIAILAIVATLVTAFVLLISGFDGF